MRRLRLSFLILLLAVVAAAVGPAGVSGAAPAPPVPAGSIGLRLVDAPVATRDDPRARVYIVDHLAPGTVISRRIEVSNTTDATADVSLYAAAASITDGSFLGAEGHTVNDLSTWTSVSPAASGVPPGGTLMATVTIDVPADAAPGEQYGVVWAEVSSEPPAGGGVAQVSRSGSACTCPSDPVGRPPLTSRSTR